MSARTTILLSATLLGGLAASASRSFAEKPGDLAEPSASAATARAFVELWNDVDGQVPVDSAAILDHAGELVDQLKSRFQSAAGEPLAGEARPPYLVVGRRVVHRDELCPLLIRAGETSCRVRAAVQWTNLSIDLEKQALRRAELVAHQYNLAEIRRVYVELQLAAAARHKAHQDLWNLMTGKGQVVATDLSTGIQRLATDFEAAGHVNELLATVNSPIQVRPAGHMEARDLHPLDRLKALRVNKSALLDLSELIDAELRALAAEHLAMARQTLEHGSEVERVVAISSLGWWNRGQGWTLVLKSLNGESSAIRQAAMSALSRFDHTSATLKKLVDNPDPLVRIKAAELAQQQVHLPQVALRVIGDLLKDPDQGVRQSAYRSMEGLASLYDPTLRDLLDYAARATRAKDTAAILDAVKWIEQVGDNTQQDVLLYKCLGLSELVAHHNGQVRQAVQDSLTRLSAQIKK